MAGRDISCTHVAMGSVRVMRTCGMMGEVVGLAAAVCNRHSSLPRSVYTDYFGELIPLMQQGAGRPGLFHHFNHFPALRDSPVMCLLPSRAIVASITRTISPGVRQ